MRLLLLTMILLYAVNMDAKRMPKESYNESDVSIPEKNSTHNETLITTTEPTTAEEELNQVLMSLFVMIVACVNLVAVTFFVCYVRRGKRNRDVECRQIKFLSSAEKLGMMAKC